MRILVWQELFWPYMGGAEITASKLMSALSERGHEIIVVTRQDQSNLPSEDHYCGLSIYRYPFWAALNSGRPEGLLHLRQQIIELKRTFKPEVVHMNCFGPSWFFHQDTTKPAGEPLLVTLHTMPDHAMMLKALGTGGLLRRTLHRAAWVTCVSETVLRHTRELAPEVARYSSVVYNGVTDAPILPAPLSNCPPRLLCVGRLAPEKGFDLALRGFALLRAVFPDARLIIAGDGELRRELTNQAAEMRLGDAVDFTGWVAPTRIWQLIESATVVLMPSRSEGLPTVALEAGVMARPLVATRVGGIPEVVVDRETGLLVEPEDFHSLADAVRRLLIDHELAVTMGHAARRRVQTVFGFARYVDSYEALYQRLVGSSRYVS